jgi:hypothetical protein
LPPVMAPWIAGADTTEPSRTIANWSRTEVGFPLAKYLLNIVLVRLANALEPAPLRVKLTTHWLLEFSAAPAVVRSLPMTGEVSSTYLTPLLSQATICVFGLSQALELVP